MAAYRFEDYMKTKCKKHADEFEDYMRSKCKKYADEDTIAVSAIVVCAMHDRMFGQPMQDDEVVSLARESATRLEKNPDFAEEEVRRRLQLLEQGLKGVVKDDDYDGKAKAAIQGMLCDYAKGGGLIPSETKFVDFIDTTCSPRHVRVDPVGNSALSTYIYENGVYYSVTDQMLGARVRDLFREYDLYDLFRMRFCNEVVSQCGLASRPYFIEDINANMENLINFRNGLLDLDTMILKPHTPDVFTTIQLPCYWTGKPSPTPVFDGYLETLADGNKEVVRFILEFMGAIFSNIPMHRFKKSLLLYGTGDCGKSQLGALICRILGTLYATSIEMELLTKNQFATSQLFGKRFASCNDMTYARLKDLSIFKQFTGGDQIRIEFKGKGATSIVWPGGMLWVCNDRPLFGGDQGRHVYERLIPIPCNNVIPKDKQNARLLDQMLMETEGIVYKSVMAFVEDVYDMGDHMKFNEPSFVVEERRKYAAANAPDVDFFQRYMRPSESSEDTARELTVTTYYEAYKKWYIDQNGPEYLKTKKELFSDLATYLGKNVDQIKSRRTDGRTYLVGYTPSLPYDRNPDASSKDLDFINCVLCDIDLNPTGYMLKDGDPALRASAESTYAQYE